MFGGILARAGFLSQKQLKCGAVPTLTAAWREWGSDNECESKPVEQTRNIWCCCCCRAKSASFGNMGTNILKRVVERRQAPHLQRWPRPNFNKKRQKFKNDDDGDDCSHQWRQIHIATNIDARFRPRDTHAYVYTIFSEQDLYIWNRTFFFLVISQCNPLHAVYHPYPVKQKTGATFTVVVVRLPAKAAPSRYEYYVFPFVEQGRAKFNWLFSSTADDDFSLDKNVGPRTNFSIDLKISTSLSFLFAQI